MARYSLAAAFLALLAINAAAQAHEGDEAWDYIPATIPTTLSDMAVSVLTVGGNTNSTDAISTKRIILTGGCDSPDGNVFVDVDGVNDFFSCFSLSQKAYAFDPIRHSSFQEWNGEFETLADMPQKRARHASVVVNGNVCVFGGRDEMDGLIAEVDCYDPTANEWSTPFSLPEKYQSSDFTAYATPEDSKVYLIGGYDPMYIALDRVTIVDMTDMANPTYVEGPTLGEKRGDIDVAVLNGEVYVSGGFTDEDGYATPKNTVEKYNLATKTWTEVDALNKERGDKQLVALNGKVYALGGEAKVDTVGVPADELPELGARSEVLDSVEVLDPTQDVHGGLPEWRSLAGMPGQLFRFAASEWEVEGEEDGYIFVFGGQGEYDSDCKCFRTSDKVMVFDVSHAEEGVETKSSGNVVGGAALFVRAFSTVAAGLLWFTAL